MRELILTPPIAFAIIFIAIWISSRLLSALAARPAKRPEDATKAYACGEDVPSHLIQPDYGQFFPFAFFFTILHVVALTIATVPTATRSSLAIAVIYITGALIGLVILFRR